MEFDFVSRSYFLVAPLCRPKSGYLYVKLSLEIINVSAFFLPLLKAQMPFTMISIAMVFWAPRSLATEFCLVGNLQ